MKVCHNIDTEFRIILIGFMGSGKSSIAKLLAEHLNFAIIEMDAIILQRTGCKDMHELFTKGGEPLLRMLEVDIARDHKDRNNVVISTGGGVVMNDVVMNDLKEGNGKVVWLNASFSTIVSRLANDKSRPLFNTIEEAETLYKFRAPLYNKYADMTVNIDDTPIEKIVVEIIANLKYRELSTQR